MSSEYGDLMDLADRLNLEERVKQLETPTPRRRSAWHEDFGDVLWWKFPIEEPPYCGTPLDDDFPDYVTHWTRFAIPKEP